MSSQEARGCIRVTPTTASRPITALCRSAICCSGDAILPADYTITMTRECLYWPDDVVELGGPRDARRCSMKHDENTFKDERLRLLSRPSRRQHFTQVAQDHNEVASHCCQLGRLVYQPPTATAFTTATRQLHLPTYLAGICLSNPVLDSHWNQFWIHSANWMAF